MIAYISTGPTALRETAAQTIRRGGLKPTYHLDTPGIRGIYLVPGWSTDPTARAERTIALMAGWWIWGARA